MNHRFSEPFGPNGGGAFCKTCGYTEHTPLYKEPFTQSDSCFCDFCQGVSHAERQGA